MLFDHLCSRTNAHVKIKQVTITIYPDSASLISPLLRNDLQDPRYLPLLRRGVTLVLDEDATILKSQNSVYLYRVLWVRSLKPKSCLLIVDIKTSHSALHQSRDLPYCPTTPAPAITVQQNLC